MKPLKIIALLIGLSLFGYGFVTLIVSITAEELPFAIAALFFAVGILYIKASN